MSNSDEIERLVAHARQEAAQAHEQQTGSLSPEGAARSRSAAAELIESLPGRLTDISMESSGAMQWRSENMSAGGTEFQLRWVDPAPERTLSIVVEDSGVVLWGWFAERVRPAYKPWNAAGFTAAFLLDLVAALADQAAWAEGRTPEVNFGRGA